MTNSCKDLNGFNRLPIYLLGISIALFSLNVSVAGVTQQGEKKEAAASKYPSFTANYELKHEPSREIIARYRMTISENGFRVDQQGDGAKASIILSNQLDRMWLLDRTMKHFHEVPIRVAKTGESSSMPTDIFVKTDQHKEEGLLAGFIQFKPCNGMSSKRWSDVHSDSQSMQIWTCFLGTKIIEKQWFDTEYGVVVRSESFDGMVATISDIQTILLGVEFFKPPGSYRKVALEALMPGSQSLEKYDNNNSMSVRSKGLNHSLAESAMEKDNGYTAN